MADMIGLPQKESRYININFKLTEAEKDELVRYAHQIGSTSLHIAARDGLINFLIQERDAALGELNGGQDAQSA